MPHAPRVKASTPRWVKVREMIARTHSLTFSGRLLERGFWLYVWEIKSAGRTLHYVGRTGDSSSLNAQSPFSRMSQHFGFNPNSNSIRRHLENAGVDPAECELRLVAHGPILQEGTTLDEHRARRDVVAALEKALAEALGNAGYEVMNVVACRKPLDAGLFESVRSAFAGDFPRLTHRRDTA